MTRERGLRLVVGALIMTGAVVAFSDQIFPDRSVRGSVWGTSQEDLRSRFGEPAFVHHGRPGTQRYYYLDGGDGMRIEETKTLLVWVIGDEAVAVVFDAEYGSGHQRTSRIGSRVVPRRPRGTWRLAPRFLAGRALDEFWLTLTIALIWSVTRFLPREGKADGFAGPFRVASWGAVPFLMWGFAATVDQVSLFETLDGPPGWYFVEELATAIVALLFVTIVMVPGLLVSIRRDRWRELRNLLFIGGVVVAMVSVALDYFMFGAVMLLFGD